MKKSILTSTVCALAFTSFAQTKQPETKPVKPQYQKVVIVPMSDWETIYSVMVEARTAPLYDPKLNSDQKVRQYQAIDGYLKELQGRVKLDSIKVEAK